MKIPCATAEFGTIDAVDECCQYCSSTANRLPSNALRFGQTFETIDMVEAISG